jgi:hypothetical protein
MDGLPLIDLKQYGTGETVDDTELLLDSHSAYDEGWAFLSSQVLFILRKLPSSHIDRSSATAPCYK